MPPTKRPHVLIYVAFALLCALCIALLAATANAQTPVPNNVTGHMGGISGLPVAGTYIQFQLTNCGGNQPRILGYTGIAPSTGVFLPDSTGLVTGTIWPNDLINCGGVTGNTRWLVTNVVNNVPTGGSTCYQLLVSVNPFNLDTATPAVPCITVTPVLPNDLSAHNLILTGVLAGVNGVFGGTLQAHEFLLDFTPTPCTSGQFMTGYNSDLTVICGTPTPAPVTTVFGRTGNILAVTGDYTCAKITGAICSLPAVFYQTLQVAGVSKPQEPKLNLIAGTHTTITCADNPGATSTDCTVTATASIVGNVTQTNVTGSRTFGGGPYTNSGTTAMFISGYGTSIAGSTTADITCSDGPSTPSVVIWSTKATATFAGGHVGFSPSVPIPVGYVYQCTVSGDLSTTPGAWIESQLN